VIDEYTDYSNVYIWDSAGLPAGFRGTLVLWRKFDSSKSRNHLSIPDLVEKKADLLRKRFLCWVYEVGQLRFKGGRLVDHLKLRPDFSYWWMTLIAEKCNFYKSPQINDAIRFLAFIDWAADAKPSRIMLVSSNGDLAECISMWCRENCITFVWEQISVPAAAMSWSRGLYEMLPLSIQALVWLFKYVCERLPLRGTGVKCWRNTDGKIMFVSYTANWVPEAWKNNYYESRYWAHLPNMLKEEQRKSNWLHIYIKDELMPTAAQAAKGLIEINKNTSKTQCHVSIDSFISLVVIFQTLRDFVRICGIGIRVGENVMHKTLPDNLPNLWPLMGSNWKESMFGPSAMSNILLFNLFEAALRLLPRQETGVYLQENISWESGFIHAWRSAGHGQLIGTPHSTVRFWDLRYFFDRRGYEHSDLNRLPLPDRITCNGPKMRETFNASGYRVEDLVDVEALRYMHLSRDQRSFISVYGSEHKYQRLLVLGDSMTANLKMQMKILEKAISLIPHRVTITFKAHPICPIDPAAYSQLQLQISREPIATLIANCDVAYASAITSAAVDAYCAGVTIVSVLDPATLNLSPLRGCVGALFASTPEELAKVLMNAANSTLLSKERESYFEVDTKLTKWRKILLE